MKFLVLTDIHGSSKYLNLAIEKFNNLSCDRILLLGDILYHGPRNDLPLGYAPKEVIQVLNSLKDKILSVKGNCDAEVDEMVLEFPLHPILTLNLDGITLELVHGHNLELAEGSGYVLYGHNHVNKENDKYINIGSLSIPKDSHHTYAVIENKVLTSYDLFTDEVLMSVEL
jgi:putative phosphoesterase